METIELTTACGNLDDHLRFLIRLEFVNIYRRYRTHLIWLFIFTLFIIFLFLLPDTDRNIPLKGVLTIIALLVWLGTLIFASTIWMKYTERQKWRKDALREAFSKKQTFRFSFDKDKLYYVTDKWESAIKWETYHYYQEYKNSFFIFPENNSYAAIYYSRAELGDGNYNLLKEFAMEKLVPLKQVRK